MQIEGFVDLWIEEEKEEEESFLWWWLTWEQLWGSLFFKDVEFSCDQSKPICESLLDWNFL